MPSFREQRVWQRMNLNWSRFLCTVTEGLTLTEGEFLPNPMLFILDNSKWCESMMCMLIVEVQINHV